MSDVLRLLSVTSILRDGLGKNEGLIYWAAGEAATCALDDRIVVDAMIKSGQARDDVWKWIRDARFRTMQRAQARGTDLHKAAEALAKGAEPLITADVEPYWKQYRRWLDTWQPRTLMAEASVYNPEERYAGTLDGIVDFSGLNVLYDIKTTAHGPEKESRPPFPEVALQLAAYSRATHVGIVPPTRETTYSQRWYEFDPDARYEPMPRIDAAICVVVSPFDCYAKSVVIDDSTWAAFKFVKELARWNRFYTPALFGPAMTARKEDAA